MTVCGSQRRGYILVVTLGALVLAASLMTVLARSAIDQTRDANAAADELQHRWGTVSIRQAILQHAEQILSSAEAQRKTPLVACRATIQLGGLTVGLIISDEQSKANVNTVLANSDPSAAEDVLRRALSEAGLPTKLRLRPSIELSLATTQTSTGVISGWGQVTDGTDVSRLVALSELLTCWGDGRINLARASAPAITIAAPSLLQTDVRHLIESRGHGSIQAQGQSPLAGLLHASQVDPSHASGLTVGSACHGLWIITHDGRRVWYDLAVRDDSNSDAPRTRCFSW